MPGVVQVLEKINSVALVLGNTRYVEGVGFVPRGNAQIVIANGKGPLLEQVLAMDDLSVSVQPPCLGLVVLADSFNCSGRFLDGSEFQRAVKAV